MRKRDPLTGKVIDSRYVDAKSGEKARLSPLQKKMKRKYGSRYVEDRVEPSPFRLGGFSAMREDMFGLGSSSSRKKRSGFDDMFGF